MHIRLHHTSSNKNTIFRISLCLDHFRNGIFTRFDFENYWLKIINLIIFNLIINIAFYISYDYGFAPIIEVMQHPLIAIRDTGILLVNDILAVYDNMILTEQAVVGRV